MGWREVALEGRRLHCAEVQARKQHRACAERLAIRADGCAAGIAHECGELCDARVIERNGDLRGLESAARLARRELPRAALASGGCAGAGRLALAACCHESVSLSRR